MIGDDRYQDVGNILCSYLKRVDAEPDPEDVSASSAFLKLKLKRLRSGENLVQHLEDTHIAKRKKAARSSKSKTLCVHCGGGHGSSNCWDKFPELRPQRYGGVAGLRRPAPGAG